jgi:hypothetical protein
MDAGREGVCSSQGGQAGGELLTFGVGERFEKRFTMFSGEFADGSQALFACLREMQCVETSVGRVATALDEAVVLETVDKGHQAAGRHPQLCCQLLLRAPRLPRNRPQQPGDRRRRVGLLEPLGEDVGGVGAQLSEQERDLAGPHPCRLGTHPATVTSENRINVISF